MTFFRTLGPWILFVTVGFALAASPSGGNSAGAPAGSAQEGCTCHNAQPDSSIAVGLETLLEGYEPEKEYVLKFVIDGPGPLPPPVGQSAGGFALQVDRGKLSPADGNTQLRETTLTHTTVGNNQRAWNFKWTAPEEGIETATFSFAGNAVNGDGFSNSQDHWKLGKRSLDPQALPETPTESSSSPTVAHLPSWAKSLLLTLVLSLVLTLATSGYVRFGRKKKPKEGARG